MSQNIRSGKAGDLSNPMSLFGYVKPSRIHFGDNSPINSQFENFHYYVDNLDGKVWIKQDGEWSEHGDLSLVGGNVSNIDDLGDVDVSTVPPNTNEVLKWDGVNWKPAVDEGDVTTAKGDLITNNGSGAVSKPVGVDGKYLKADSAQPDGLLWDDVTNIVDVGTTKGDLITRDASSYQKLSIGNDGDLLVSDSAETNGMKWVSKSYGVFEAFTSSVTTTLSVPSANTFKEIDLLNPSTTSHASADIVKNGPDNGFEYLGAEDKTFLVRYSFNSSAPVATQIKYAISKNGELVTLTTANLSVNVAVANQFQSVMIEGVLEMSTNDKSTLVGTVLGGVPRDVQTTAWCITVREL